MSKERCLTRTGAEIRALQGGSTQIWVPVKNVPLGIIDDWLEELALYRCPLGVPGDTLVFRETWQEDPVHPGVVVCYRAGYWHHQDCGFEGHLWRRPQNMPARLARYRAKIVSVDVRRVQEVTPEDILATGIDSHVLADGHAQYPQEFIERWEARYPDYPYSGDPWSGDPWAFRIVHEEIG